jgi:hypothetical protein
MNAMRFVSSLVAEMRLPSGLEWALAFGGLPVDLPPLRAARDPRLFAERAKRLPPFVEAGLPAETIATTCRLVLGAYYGPWRAPFALLWIQIAKFLNLTVGGVLRRAIHRVFGVHFEVAPGICGICYADDPEYAARVDAEVLALIEAECAEFVEGEASVGQVTDEVAP